MALNIPDSALTIFNRISSDIVNEINELDPYLRNSLLRSIGVADSNAFFELYKTLQQLELLTFWDTSEGDALVRWAAIYGITRNPATTASGFITLTGVDGSEIPVATELSSDSGGIYETQLSAEISEQILSVTSLTRSGSIVTVTTSINHGLASNVSVTISGADQTDYNGDFDITVTGLNTFTYTISTTPTTPATGSILINATYATVEIKSNEAGESLNLQSGTAVSLSSPIAGIDSTGYVAFDEVGGGTDQESDDSLRDRFLFRVQNPKTPFNESAIVDLAKLVSGVTRVFVQTAGSRIASITPSSVTYGSNFVTIESTSAHGLFDGQEVTVVGANESEYNVDSRPISIINSTKFGYGIDSSPTSPATGPITVAFGISTAGQVRVFFTRDNDDDIIPTESEVETVRNVLLENKNADLQPSNLIVSAPTPITVDFTFSELTPNTTAMQSAIETNLKSFFQTQTEVAKDVSQIDYNSIINSTLDSGGNQVESFTLSSPSADISAGISDLAVLGTITYP